ncbi:hypothetical protein DQ04_08901020 [Trypanosoma grayi]|uniref:hypothetical protein n=1 Tax=Trypanosoma grayi TaxID=71804 RepID=UPI0004F40E50|nr:hypothetical protein DQ04_08901020 [Trypanosoma grayi]KEG07754.1 hypothetical protein DQ04_08901020 [Trypanosoma grayi]
MSSAMEVVRHVKASGGILDSICNLIIRPPRAAYDPETDLGPEVFRVDDGDSERYKRSDLTLWNMRDEKVVCSWFHPLHEQRRPCVVYLHANCGSRYDALEALFLLRHGFSLFAFDATGSGLSDGEYVSLGFYERQDLATVVEYLAAQREVAGIGLWGRSMGAVASIMYAAKDPSIKCIVCDSPFSTLRLLIKDLVRRHGSKHFPSLIINTIVGRIRKRIAQSANFDIDDISAVKYASECVVPAFIFHGAKDDFVAPQHSITVCNAFKGSALHHVVVGGHNDERDSTVQDTIRNFFTLYLLLKPEGERLRHVQLESVVGKEQKHEVSAPSHTKNKSNEDESSSDDEENHTSSTNDNRNKACSDSVSYAPLEQIRFSKLRLREADGSLAPACNVDGAQEESVEPPA